VRYVLIGAHYRKQLNFTLDSLHAAREAMEKLAKGARALAAKAPAEARFDSVDFGPFQAAWDSLNDDLNTPGCLGGLFTGLRDAAKLEGGEAAKALAAFNRVLRAIGLTLPEEEPEADVPAEIRALAEERWAARTAKDWAKADVMRGQLTELGWNMKDGKESYELTPV
jgi:cysteinyl-tRNA synthetase